MVNVASLHGLYIMPKRFYDILLVIFALAFVLFTARKPIYNWDMIAYMGVVEEYSVHDIQKVHDNVYKTVQAEIPTTVFAGLTDHEEDRYECLTDANVFHDELSFFRAKPLYTFLVYLFHKAGVPFVMSTLIPSIIAGIIMLLLVYTWLCVYLKRPLALIATVLLALMPPFAELVRFSTPDALSNLILLWSAYLIATNKINRWLVLSLCLSLVARVDNFVFVMVAIFFVYMNGRVKLDVRMLSIVGVGLLGVIGIPMLFGDAFTWFTKFAFLFSISDYAHHWKMVLYEIRTSQYILMVLFSIFLLYNGDKQTVRVVKIIVVTFIVRLFLFPSIQERFFVGFEFIIAILLIGFMQQLAAKKMPQQVNVTAQEIS